MQPVSGQLQNDIVAVLDHKYNQIKNIVAKLG